MARGRDWILGLLLLAAAGVFVFVILSYFFGDSRAGLDLTSESRLGLVEVRGVILESAPIVKQLEDYADNSSIKGIILRIDSPGGGVAASQEIYEAVKRVRNDGKFVVASMASVAASGGYYIACGADTIMANPGTTTGSIGVIAEMINTTELLNKIGVRFEIIKSGKYKDSGTAFRPMTADDRKYLQGFVDDAYQQFVEVVTDERQLPRQQVLKHADGRVFTGKQALELQLIDLLGTYQDAIDLAASVVGIKGKPRIVKPTKRKVTVWDLFFGDLQEHVTRLQTLPALRYQMIL